MNSTNDDTARVLADVVVQLGRVTHDYVFGLSPAQWSALRYLARANRCSRTVSAFADFHATTRGTASQTVKSLVTRGYLRKTRSSDDGRSSVLDLTEAGRGLLAHDPCEALVAAAEGLPQGVQARTARGLKQLLATLERVARVRPFGICADCEYLEDRGARAGGGELEVNESPACSLMGKSLEVGELGQVCSNFRSAATVRS